MKYLFLLVVVVLVGCDQENKNATTKESDVKFRGSDVSIIEIDSCEYIYFFLGKGPGFTHKGNCKYCAERSNLKFNKQ